jgi:thiol-disulfide isomerase/thioredoxin
MFRQSVLLVAAVIGAIVLGMLTGTQIFGQRLPSAYDPGLRLDAAVAKASKPLLIEFYTDDCGTCQRTTPWVVDWVRQNESAFQWVMVDLNDSANRPFAELFRVEAVPSIYFFDPRRMKKIEVPEMALASPSQMHQALSRALARMRESANAKKSPAQTVYRTPWQAQQKEPPTVKDPK